MIFALTGTPGTGKTSVARMLSDIYDVRSVKEIAEENDCIIDVEDDSLVIDIDSLSEIVRQFRQLDIVIEGHLSHLLSPDVVIVLRCNPKVLKERLLNRNWSEEKIRENLEAEVLDVILVESIEEVDRVYEIDTTDRSVEDVAKIVVEIIEFEKRGIEAKNFKPGSVDWISVLGDEVDDFLRI
ncbi:putative nucleotide kinase (related to CMP and AMP kinases) [Archaeoglobus sulfaticallidus PM70-1]|uniref:Putative adenylate kinase n=1 Tax=Archaeoglobus sulfaticallidus PM70-1 TaxID=387631 RepID=N0BNI4_9EURY|nr:adenylate kinase family protein [Archaeoglobus sulfaticallidus]AGK62226.1 putative nucleotide kinase (related to CMP and AMP kinases) [Archaeoglobus sulfaticallidus PM70-1]